MVYTANQEECATSIVIDGSIKKERFTEEASFVGYFKIKCYPKSYYAGTTARIDFSLIVWIAMLINMGLGGFMGSFIPFTLKRMNLDPASGSSIFTTGVTDSGGFFIFLGLGSIFLV